jgi:hypothetical protein
MVETQKNDRIPGVPRLLRIWPHSAVFEIKIHSWVLDRRALCVSGNGIIAEGKPQVLQVD